MDLTNVFKACIKTVKTRNRALSSPYDRGNGDGINKNNILGHTKKRQEFERKAREIVNNITKLRDYVLKHRKAYINVDHLLETSSMLEAERDQIDTDVQAVIRTCSQVLRDFKQNVLGQTCTSQQKDHRQLVIQHIEKYLKEVCRIYSEQRAIRVKRDVTKQRILRLEPNTKTLKSGQTALLSTSVTTPLDESYDSNAQSNDWQSMDNESDLSPEEIQLFEQENQWLYDDLSTLSDEVRQIEGQVMEISKLQDIFTSEILQQDQHMDRISDTTIHATENIKAANENIRQAMKKNASFRVWLLFFLIVMAFSLLFLDWYNE